MHVSGDGIYSDVALFGKDPTPRLLDVQPVRNGSDDRQALVRVYRRSEDLLTVTTDEEKIFPFFFLSDIHLLKSFQRNRYRFNELEGENPYRYLVAFDTWRDYWDAVRLIERATGQSGRRSDALYLIPSPAQQYLMQSGRTCFKEMALNDLYRMQLDIEVTTEHGFPNAARKEDEVIIVALSDNRGRVHLLDRREMSEPELLRELVRQIREWDPDVIEGHNILAFDFAYLMTRCERYGVSFAIGRDGSVPRTFSANMRFAERTVEYPALEIAGRHVIDTYFQVISYDVVKRDMPSYGLKAAARYFGFAPKDRTYVEGKDIARLWKTDPERLLSYARDDVMETEKLARHLSGSSFYLTQIVPMTYGQVARTGPAAKIESLFVREYLRRRHSIPGSEWGSQAAGGYTDVFVTGVLGPIVYADVESLYPSIMLNYDVKPKSDTLALFPALLRRLTDLRFETKRKMKAASTDEERSELDARQSTYKVLINSFYGSLGFGHAVFNDFAEADRVATTGQQLLRQIIGLIRQNGGLVVEVDTDGVLFVPPDDVRGEEAEQAFVRRLSDEMPAGINIGFDGRFQRMLSYKKKNYALLTYDGRLRFKGSSLVSRSSERFGRHFVREATRRLIDEDVNGLHALYIETRERIIAHEWDSVDDFSRTETLKDSTTRYLEDVEANRRTRAASYELAIQQAAETGLPPRQGDRISYYITGSSATVVGFENARLADAWDPSNPDENTAFYLKRLDEFARKFEPFFTDHDFRLIFSPEDLFGFSAEGIRLQRHQQAIDSLEGTAPF